MIEIMEIPREEELKSVWNELDLEQSQVEMELDFGSCVYLRSVT